MQVEQIFAEIESYKNTMTVIELVKEVEAYLGFPLFKNPNTAKNYFSQWKKGKSIFLDKLLIFYFYVKMKNLEK